MSLFAKLIAEVETLFHLVRSNPAAVIAQAPAIMAQASAVVDTAEHDISTAEGAVNAAVKVAQGVAAESGAQIEQEVVTKMISGAVSVLTASAAKSAEAAASTGTTSSAS